MYFPNKLLAEEIVSLYGSPVFITNKSALKERVTLLKEALPCNGKIFYALKANSNPKIVSALREYGIDGIDAVSPFEVMMAEKCGFKGSEIIFTGNNSEISDFDYMVDREVLINIGSISELERFGSRHPGKKIFLRFNPDTGAGETKQVTTGGKESKFGILSSDVEATQLLVKKYNLRVVGIHSHIGSGIYDAKIFKKAVKAIIKIAMNFKELEFLDLGGGFGVRYSPDAGVVNVRSFFDEVRSDLKNFEESNKAPISIIIEPGKFLVAESTCLLTQVTDTKVNDGMMFVGTNTGMNHIIRPALYSANHHVINISSPKEKEKYITLVGNICESTDVLRQEINLPMPKIGDILAILTAGAYCASMSSLYNMRPYAAEVMVDEGHKLSLIRKRFSFNDTIKSLGY